MDHRPHCFAGFGCKCLPELAPIIQVDFDAEPDGVPSYHVAGGYRDLSPGPLVGRCLAAIGAAIAWLLRWP